MNWGRLPGWAWVISMPPPPASSKCSRVEGRPVRRRGLSGGLAPARRRASRSLPDPTDRDRPGSRTARLPLHRLRRCLQLATHGHPKRRRSPPRAALPSFAGLGDTPSDQARSAPDGDPRRRAGVAVPSAVARRTGAAPPQGRRARVRPQAAADGCRARGARKDGRMTAPPHSRFLLHPSPLGDVLIVATDEGIVTLHPLREALENEIERLSRVLHGGLDHADDDPVAIEAARQLDEYFAGERREFDLPLDWRLVRGFTRAALETIRDIPYGEMAGYGEVAVECRQRARRTRGRHSVRHDSVLHRRAGAPRGASRRLDRRIRRAPRRQGVPARPRAGRERVGRSRPRGPADSVVPGPRTSAGGNSRAESVIRS